MWLYLVVIAWAAFVFAVQLYGFYRIAPRRSKERLLESFRNGELDLFFDKVSLKIAHHQLDIAKDMSEDIQVGIMTNLLGSYDEVNKKLKPSEFMKQLVQTWKYQMMAEQGRAARQMNIVEDQEMSPEEQALSYGSEFIDSFAEQLTGHPCPPVIKNKIFHQLFGKKGESRPVTTDSWGPPGGWV